MSSFAINQMIGNLNAQLAELKAHPELAPVMRTNPQKIQAQLKLLNDQLNTMAPVASAGGGGGGVDPAEEAKAAKKAEQAAVRKEKAWMKKMVDEGGKVLSCSDCSSTFAFTVGEMEWYAEKGLSDPTICKGCRAEKRQNRLQALELECCDCSEFFYFSVKDQIHFKEHGFPAPKRCRPCQSAKKAAFANKVAPAPAGGKMLPCTDCKKNFFFADESQAHFTEKGWDLPKRCAPCRKAKKAKGPPVPALAPAVAVAVAPTEAVAEAEAVAVAVAEVDDMPALDDMPGLDPVGGSAEVPPPAPVEE